MASLSEVRYLLSSCRLEGIFVFPRDDDDDAALAPPGREVRV